MDVEVVGAIKIKDGLFIGDEFAAQDLEFVITNKVTHIINCAGRQIPNFWESIGVTYLTYNWVDSDNQILFDQRGDVVNEIFNFIEEALQNGESVLVHSLKGQSRSCCVIGAYFMKRFRWSLYKTLEFLTSRRPDLEIRASFYHQLTNLEAKIVQELGGSISANWYDIKGEVDNEELLLRNTFLNAKNAPLDEHLINPRNVGDIRQRINWPDLKTNDKSKLNIYLGSDGKNRPKLKPFIKSILKGSSKVFTANGKEKEESSVHNSATKSPSTANNAGGLRLNKSLKTLHEEKTANNTMNSSYSTIIKRTVPSKVVDFSDGPQSGSASKPNNKYGSQSMPRSSSASNFDREENLSNYSDKDSKGVGNINGNIIHVTVNNFIAPLNNVNNLIQPNAIVIGNSRPGSQQGKKNSEHDLEKYRVPLDKKDPNLEPLNSNDSFSKILNDPNVDKNSLNYLAARQLKLALEKKLSKEQTTGSNKDAPSANDDGRPNNTDPSEIKGTNGTEKGYTKSTELKLTYQPNLPKRGETPPPRRDDNKKATDSVYAKALSKSSLLNNNNNTKSKTDNTLTNSSNYFQNLFPSTLMQLNSLTPSSNPTNVQTIDKKTPSSTKAVSSNTSSNSYNFGPYRTQMTLQRPQSSHQTKENNQSSSFIDNLMKSSNTFANYQPSQTSQNFGFRTQVNNFTTTSTSNKAGPVKAEHSSNNSNKSLERPRSAQLNRSATPNPTTNMPGRNPTQISYTSEKKDFTSSNSGMSYLRSFSPSAKNSTNNTSSGSDFSYQNLNSNNIYDPTKLVRKESPTSQNAPGKYRQRSSSPSQNFNYNTMFSTSSSKPRWKF